MEEDEYDSADDLFITQSNFRTDTQDAANAAEFLETDFNLSFDLEAPETVEYWDFSKEVTNVQQGNSDTKHEDHVIDTAVNVVVGEEPSVPLLPNLQDDEVTDEVLSSTLDAVIDSLPDEKWFAAPVSDATVQESSAKGYVTFSLLKW